MKIEVNENKSENIDYLLKSIYLIRSNFPSSEYLYIAMYFLKYFGYIIWSIYLTQNLKNEQEEELKENLLISFLSTFLINGNNLIILKNLYQEICIGGFIILIVLLFITFYTLFCMRKQNTYSDKNGKKHNKEWYIINLKIKKISGNKTHKTIFKLISYIFFLIVFFHQYITEYYFFGFLGHILYIFGLFKDKTNSRVIAINEYFSNSFFNPWILIPINLIVILIVNTLLIFFMLLNINKCLFLQKGLAFTANNLFLSIKFVYFNLSPFFGIILALNKKIRVIVSIVISSITIFLFILNNILSTREFTAYENKLIIVCIFIESFGFISSILELITFISKVNEKSLIFILIKYIIIIFNSLALTCIILHNTHKIAADLFAKELFCNNNYRDVKINDIYYYMKAYLSYSKNKKTNYVNILKIIKLHTLTCNRKDCPGKKLITRHMLDSPFTEFTKNDYEENIDDNNDEKIINSFGSEDKNIKLDLNFDLNTGNDLHSTVGSRNNVNSIIKNISSDFLEVNNEIDINQKIISGLNKNKKDTRRSVSGKSITYQKDSTIKNTNTDSINKGVDKDTNIIESINPSHMKRTSIFSINELKNEINEKGGIWNHANKGLMMKMKKEKEKHCGEHHQNFDEGKLKDSQFQIIGEQEILNRMHFLYKRKKFQILEEYIFVHLQYLLMVKQNYKMVLYFIGKYSNCGIKLCFLSQYFLYEIKKYVIKNFFSLHNSLIEDSYVNKYRKEHIYLKEFFKYIRYIRIIKQILDTSCENILNFFTFRRELHSPILIQKYYNTKIYPILKSANELKTHLKKLNNIMKAYVHENKQKIQSIELSYLITNFYKLINNGDIPQFILKYINPVVKFKEQQFENLENEYQLYFMGNPLILALTKKDTFIINYFSSILCEKLGFTPNELKFQDFHDKLFPSNSEMIREHSLLMKQFIFYEKISFKKEESFIKNKDGYLTRINMHSKLFPNFTKEFYIIANIALLNDDMLKTHKKKEEENELKNNNINKNNTILSDNQINKPYSFLLNDNFDFMGITENFYDEFNINQILLGELKINFCQFFCVDENKLINKIIKERHTNIKVKNYKETQINLSEGNCVHSIFKTIPYENMFVLRDSKLFDLFLYPKFFIIDKIDKKKLIKLIPELMSTIDENGLDYKWYELLQNYKNRLLNGDKDNLSNDQNELMQPNLNNLTPGKRNKSLANVYNFSQNYARSDTMKKKFIRLLSEKDSEYSYYLINKSNQYFDAIYYVNKLGKTVYYIVNLFEKNTEINKNLSSKNNFHLEKSKESLFKNINKNIEYNSKKESKTNLTYINQINAISINNTEIGAVDLNDITKKTNIFNLQTDKNQAQLKNITLVPGKSPQNKNLKNKYKEDIHTSFQNILIKIKENLNEEENSPLISKDKLNTKIKKLQYQNRIIIFIIYFLFFASLVISIVKIALSINGFSTSRNIVEEIIYFERLQLDLYVQSILSIIVCLNEKVDLTSDNNIQTSANRQLKYTKINLIKLQEKLTLMNNNNESIKKVLDIFYGPIFIQRLNNNWEIDNITKDSLIDEIRYLTHNMQTLSNENYNGICNWDVFKYLDVIELSENEKLIEKPNDFSKLVFYFFSNFISNFNKKFDKITTENNLVLNKVMSSYLWTILYLNFIINFIFIILLIFFRVKIYFDYSICKFLFLHYFDIREEETKFENNILLLKNVINEFNSENIQNFEIFKNTEFIQNDNTIQNQDQNSTQNIELNNTIESKTSSQKKFNDQSSIRNKVINGSINNSSSMFLMNNNQKNKKDLSTINKASKEKIKEEKMENLINNCKKTLPILFIFSPYFALVNVLFLFGIIIYNCFKLNSELVKWDFCVNLSSNILEQIVKLMEFVFFTYVSVIRGKESIEAGSTWEMHIQNLPPYIKYFYDPSNLIGKDLSEKYFNNSRYAELIVDNYLINENLQKYLFEGKKNYFPTTKKWENLLGDTGMFCIQASIGETLSLDENFKVYDFFKHVEEYTRLCLEDGENINNSGTRLEINFILQGLVNEFIAFISAKEKNLISAQNNFYSSTQMKRIIIDMQNPFIFYFDSISYSLMIDIEKNNYDSVVGQLIFSAVIIVIIIEIIISWVFIINANENNKQQFLFFSEIPKRK